MKNVKSKNFVMLILLICGCGDSMNHPDKASGGKDGFRFRLDEYPCKDGAIRLYANFKNGTEDEVLAVISNQREIAKIFLGTTVLSSRLVDEFSKLESLEALQFNGAIPDLRPLCKNVKLFSLAINSNESLRRKGLVEMLNLEDLQLCGACADDEIMEEVSKLANLKCIALYDSPVTVDGLRLLSGLENLKLIYTDSKGDVFDEQLSVIQAMLPSNQEDYGYIGAYFEEFGSLGPYEGNAYVGVHDWRERWQAMTKEERRASTIGLVKIEDH